MHLNRAREIIKSLIFSYLFLTVALQSASGQGQDGEPFLEHIILNGDSILIPDPASDEIKLDFSFNNIGFEFNTPDSSLFCYILEGFDRDWGRWTTSNLKEYTNLSSGKYRLKIRYIYKGKTGGEFTVINFKIIPRWFLSGFALSFYIILGFLILWVLYTSVNLRFAKTQYMLEQIINKRTEDLIIEKEKSEKLLANVLPKNAANEIIEKGKATKIKYNFVTVLFSDIQGFTKIAEEVNPEVLIDELDKFFFYFDSVVERLGIEKIKTIGDAYMCAGGIPEKNRTNPVEVILAALEMQAYMLRLKQSSALEGMKYWDIRIGIHTGTVIAGVVGQKKLSYDIWGDTVNTASRMESSGEAGKINISGTTYEFVKDFFICEHRGKMPVKYKGELDMYFVLGIVPELSDEEGKPNQKFTTKIQLIKLQDIEELIIKMFDEEASPDLYFHNSTVVRNMCSQVDLLSNAEKISDEEFIIVKLAAILLFTGYVSDYLNPLEGSIRMVDTILPKYSFGEAEIYDVKNHIRNSFSNSIETKTDCILHDARYDYLGRVDFIKMTEKLLKEESEHKQLLSRNEWFERQKQLVMEHEFKTDAARLLRNIKAEDQINLLQHFQE